MEQQPVSLLGSCHCGKVQLELPSAPNSALLCNCSICRRLGALWTYYPMGQVKISGYPEHTQSYVWGDKTLQTIRCKECGCITHWLPLDGKPGTRHGVNLRNFEPRLYADIKPRHFDGADSWSFLD